MPGLLRPAVLASSRDPLLQAEQHMLTAYDMAVNQQQREMVEDSLDSIAQHLAWRAKVRCNAMPSSRLP